VSQAVDERRRAVLGAVVEHYIATGEPVSSGWVSDRAHLGVCSATIRGDMSRLERAGYLDHPHTSAGRVPTDRGYRVYAETIMSGAEPAADAGVFEELGHRHEVEDTLEATCRALARLTRYLSLAQPPTWSDERLRHLQLARLDSRRVLAVVVGESGRVHHALLEFVRLPTAGQLRALATVISDRFTGRAVAEITRERLEQAVRELWPRHSFAGRAVEVLSASMPATDDRSLVLEGGSQLLEADEFQDTSVAREVFGLIEERSYLRELLGRQRPGLSVTIGEEAGHPAMRHCALMAATFEVPGGYGSTAARPYGCIGVLGPKRMPYRSVMSALLLAARALGSALAGR